MLRETPRNPGQLLRGNTMLQREDTATLKEVGLDRMTGHRKGRLETRPMGRFCWRRREIVHMRTFCRLPGERRASSRNRRSAKRQCVALLSYRARGAVDKTLPTLVEFSVAPGPAPS